MVIYSELKFYLTRLRDLRRRSTGGSIFASTIIEIGNRHIDKHIFDYRVHPGNTSKNRKKMLKLTNNT